MRTPEHINYQMDSREQSYRFFARAFHLQASDQEDADTDSEVQTAAELAVACRQRTSRSSAWHVSWRSRFIMILRHRRTLNGWRNSGANCARWCDLSQSRLPMPGPVSERHERGLESRGYRFEFSNGLSAPGVLIQSAARPPNGGTTLLISDSGRASMLVEAANDVNRGQRVLVFDPLLFGENIPDTGDDLPGFAQMLNTIGARPLGLDAAQLAAIAHWLQADSIDGSGTPGARVMPPSRAVAPLRMVTDGPRGETVAIVSAALVPELYSSIEARHAIASLGDLFTHPLDYHHAQEVMCLDLYRYFDFDTLRLLAMPVKIDLSGKDPEPIFW